MILDARVKINLKNSNLEQAGKLQNTYGNKQKMITVQGILNDSCK